MKVTYLDLDHEALAAISAKYSRSDKGIDTLLNEYEENGSEAKKVFRFIDFGHRSIAGMSGSVPIAIDGLSMYMAYSIFANSHVIDGLESSTRYIKMDESGIVDPSYIGIPQNLCDQWMENAKTGLNLYNKYFEIFSSDTFKTERDEILKSTKNEKVAQRMVNNFALDRARRFLPFSMRTNMVVSMNIRDWGDLLCHLDAMGTYESASLRVKIVNALMPICPDLLKHTSGTTSHFRKMDEFYEHMVKPLPYKPYLRAHMAFDGFESHFDDEKTYDIGRTRYDPIPVNFDSYVISFIVPVCIAELRDLNRHRTGYKHCSLRYHETLTPVAYTGVNDPDVDNFLKNVDNMVTSVKTSKRELMPYCYFLGTETEYNRLVFGNHFLYEYQLRTGEGAHFEYKELYKQILSRLRGGNRYYENYYTLFEENNIE